MSAAEHFLRTIGCILLCQSFYFVQSANIDFDAVDYEDDGVNADAADESSLRLVSYFLRTFKFQATDFRFPGSEPVFYRQFPLPPLTPDPRVELECKRGARECVAFVNGFIRRYFVMKNDRCIELGPNSRENLRLFAVKVTAFYYLCWHTLLEDPFLKHFGFPCNNIESCNTFPDVFVPKTADSTSFACARHSFCPNFCCGAMYPDLSGGGSDGDLTLRCSTSETNPCRQFPRTAVASTCEIRTEHNRELRALIAGDVNYTCQCEMDVDQWYEESLECLDRDECAFGLDDCAPEETCIDTIGSFICLCSWGYYRSEEGFCEERSNDWLTYEDDYQEYQETAA